MTMFALRELMTEWPAFLPSDMSAAEASRLMAARPPMAMPVCSSDRTFEGMVRQRDFMTKVIDRGLDPRATAVGDISSGPDAPSIEIDDPVDVALFAMRVHGVRRLPVLEEGKLVGMVTLTTLARAMPAERQRTRVA